MAIKFAITEEEKPYHISGSDFLASFSVTISEAQQGRGGGGQPPLVYAHEDVELLVAGVVANTQQTDDNGMALFQNVAISSLSRVVAIRARVEINGVVHTSAPKSISLPHPDKKAAKPGPAELIVHPTRVGNQLDFFVKIVDEDNRGIPNAAITFVLNPGGTQKHTCNAAGEYSFPIILNPGDELEVSIYATGFGDRGFSRTFRGR